MTLDVLRAVIVAHESDTHRRHASADDRCPTRNDLAI